MTYSYIPGTCNLGKAEIKRRQTSAFVALFFTALGFLAIEMANAPTWSRWFLFVPLMGFALGFIQSRKKFCLAFGLMGTFNLGKLGEISRVQSPEDRRADRRTAMKILLQSKLLSLVITAVLVYLPF